VIRTCPNNKNFLKNKLQQRTKNAQFIIISLRSNMFELSDYLVGIYKVSDCTGSITIENQPPAAVASNKALYADSFAPLQNVTTFDNSIHEEDKENEQPVKDTSQEIQLPLTPPSQELPERIEIDQAAA
jgi:structural maintenance of chromosome 4